MAKRGESGGKTHTTIYPLFFYILLELVRRGVNKTFETVKAGWDRAERQSREEPRRKRKKAEKNIPTFM